MHARAAPRESAGIQAKSSSLDVAGAVSDLGKAIASDTSPSASVTVERCLALVAVHDDTEIDVVPDLRKAADQLIARANMDADGRVGWGLPDKGSFRTCRGPGSWDPFNKGTCNPGGTSYMYETGLAATCLARAGLVTGDRTYVDFARRVLSGSRSLGTALKGCRDCFTYWYSYHPNDRGRFVRNTNALMGMAHAWAYAATGEEHFAERAREVANALMLDLERKNFGYFAIQDPKYRASPRRESRSIDNHEIWIAKSLVDMGHALGSDRLIEAAVEVMDRWRGCDTPQCRSAPCGAWGPDYRKCPGNYPLGPCFLRSVSPKYAEICAQTTSLLRRPTPYQLWALFDARPTAETMAPGKPGAR